MNVKKAVSDTLKRGARVTALCTALTAVLTVLAQAPAVSRAGSGGHADQEKVPPPISLDLRDAPVRQALEQLFGNAGVQFSIDNAVTGFITLKITEQPFDSALRLIMRASSLPLTYTKENGVYFIKPRPLSTDISQAAAMPPLDLNAQQQKQYLPLEQVQLTYSDPFDLQGILGVSLLAHFARRPTASGSRSGTGGGLGGGLSGLGGSGGGASGGLGGLGGGMSGGMGGLGGGRSGGLR